jgi:alpha-amylase
MKNQTLMQYFHWYYQEDVKLWCRVTEEVSTLVDLGVTGVWLPPAYKATSGDTSVGYDCYDLFDLGEFDQKDCIATKYGTKEEYINAISTLKANGIATIADVVLNHKAGGDELEKIKVRKVDPQNRKEFISPVIEIEAWTKFTFPGRKGKYSNFVWDYRCFSGLDFAANLKEGGIFSIQNEFGEGWEDVPSKEHGNYDYLMFNDIESRNPAVRQELKEWGEWYYNTCGMDGFRMDAVKHISHKFLNEWIDYMKNTLKREFFIVAENWVVDNVEDLETYIELTEGRMQLFDSVLHHNLYVASQEQETYDLSKIFEGTLTELKPCLSVTFVDNHDSQPLQALESFVEAWFRPLAYALILLREQGMPCLFYPDLYGCSYKDKDHSGNEVEIELSAVFELPKLCSIRKDLSYGIQRNYLDHPNCIGWTREGDDEHPNSGVAILMSNSGPGIKNMEMGLKHANKTFIDELGNITEPTVVNKDGWASFLCAEKRVSVWVLKPD